MDSKIMDDIPDYVIDHIVQKRGRLRIFDRIEPSRTALIIIDMQRYYLDQIGSTSTLIPIVSRLATTFREKGARVAWVKMTVGRDGDSLWPFYHENFFRPDLGARHRDQLSESAPGHLLHPELKSEPEDLYATKSRFSAFFPGTCDLHEQLTEHGIRHVVICGVATNICCETSARDAMMLNYRVTMISDATATLNEADHRSTMISVVQNFGDVLTSKEIIGEL